MSEAERERLSVLDHSLLASHRLDMVRSARSSRCSASLTCLHLPASLQHGVKRSRIPPVADSAEVERKKREKEAKRIEEYTGLVTALRKLVSLPCFVWTCSCS